MLDKVAQTGGEGVAKALRSKLLLTRGGRAPL